MVSFLIRKLVKNYREIRDPRVRRGYGTVCGAVGIFLNLCLFAGKYLAGVLSGSIAVLADAFNNLSDAGASVMTLVGFQMAGKKPDARHPFGHGRIEYLSGLAVSAAIVVMGFELARSSVQKIHTPSLPEPGLLPAVILAVSVAVKLYMAYYNRKIGAQIDSTAIRAAASDSLCDAAATLTVGGSMAITAFTGWNADGWCGLALSLFILYAGCKSALETVNPLLGQPPDPHLIEEIRRITLSRPEILGMHDLVVHNYGPGRMMISLHGEVSGKQDLFTIHEVIDGVERELAEKLGCDAVIHMDPVDPEDEEAIRMQGRVKELVKEIHPSITVHDFRVIRGSEENNLIFDVVIPYQVKMTDEEAAETISRRVSEEMKNCRAVVSIDHAQVL